MTGKQLNTYTQALARNVGRCTACDQVIESKHVHHMQWCVGGHVAVDGGLEYLKRSGSIELFEELSEWTDYEREPVKFIKVPMTTMCDVQNDAAVAIRQKKYTPKLIGTKTMNDAEIVILLADMADDEFEQAVKFGQVALVGKLFGMKRGKLTRRVRAYKATLAESCLDPLIVASQN